MITSNWTWYILTSYHFNYSYAHLQAQFTRKRRVCCGNVFLYILYLLSFLFSFLLFSFFCAHSSVICFLFSFLVVCILFSLLFTFLLVHIHIVRAIQYMHSNTRTLENMNVNMPQWGGSIPEIKYMLSMQQHQIVIRHKSDELQSFCHISIITWLATPG